MTETRRLRSRSYKAAGVVFTDGHLILAGYQPLKAAPFISGIGGSKEEGETYKETALREMVEELFETSVPPALLAELKTYVSHSPRKVLRSATYVRLVYTFEDLVDMLAIMKKHIKSPLYATFPLTLMDLLFHRRVGAKAEISHLCLLPVVKHDTRDPLVVSYFVKEMRDY
jgi:NUDIX domain